MKKDVNIPEKEMKELDNSLSKVTDSALYAAIAFIIPAALIWAVSPENEGKTTKTLYTMALLCLLAVGFGPKIYKNAKQYIQLKKKLQNQYSR